MRDTWALPLLFLISACVDLSAVRDFAKESSTVMAASEPVLSNWPSPDFIHAQQIARSPVMRKAAPDFAAQLDEDARNSENFAPLIKLSAQTLQLYFSVLAVAADTGVADMSSQAAGIDKSLTALKVESTHGKGLAAQGSAKAILQLLQIPLDLARQAAVRDLVLKSNNDVQVITNYLAESAKWIAEIDVDAGKTLGKYYDVSSLGSRDSAGQALLRARGWDQEAAGQASEVQATKLAIALQTIGKDHAVLARNAKQLSSAAVKATLATDAPLIEVALKPFLSR